jgi:hypothetical protein
MRIQIFTCPAKRIRYADFAEQTDFTENQSLKNFLLRVILSAPALAVALAKRGQRV